MLKLVQSDDTQLDIQPIVDAIFGFKGIWTLCRENGTIVHYAVCLVGGKEPLWAVFTHEGKFMRFWGLKQNIVDRYPKLKWRLRPAKWKFIGEAPKTPAQRKAAILEIYKK